MSQFSEKLKKMVSMSGNTIYKLSQNAGLDRTTIQRALSGERLPGVQFVDTLCSHLKLTPSELSEVKELYLSAKIGDEKYQGRKYIKTLIENITNTQVYKHQKLEISRTVTEQWTQPKEVQVIHGQYSILDAIRKLLVKEVSESKKCHIATNIPYHFDFFYDLLLQLYLEENGNMTIRNSVKMCKDPATFYSPNYNLEVLSHVIQFAFSAGAGYQAYYYYDNFDASKDFNAVLPYYIKTENFLLTLSSDFKKAVYYTHKDMLELYANEIERILSQSTPFINQHSSPIGILEEYMELFQKCGDITHVIEPQPCLAWYYTKELIGQYINQDIPYRDIIVERVNELYGNYRRRNNRPLSIFSKEGLHYMAQTGRMADLPEQFAMPFTIETRIHLLNALKTDMRNGIYKVHMTHTELFSIPECTVQLYAGKDLEFFTSNNNGVISSSSIQENTIKESFYDFFESLPESGLVLSLEETLQVIEETIAYCQSLQNNTVTEN